MQLATADTTFVPACCLMCACARVTPVAVRGSGVLSSSARANCFIVLPEGTGQTAADEIVSVQLFDRLT